MPTTDKNVLLEISRRLNSLPERQAGVARFVLEHPEEAKGISLQELCERCDTSEPVVFAFCKALGFSGFKAFKLEIATALGARDAKNATSVFVADESITSSSHPGAIFRAVAALYARSLDETSASVDPERFAVAVERISKAGRIVLLGVGISGNVGFLAQQNFLRTGIPVTWTCDPNLFFTHLAPLKSGDVVIALSQTGSQKDTLDGIAFARKRGLTVISVTSDPESPIATEANILLLTGPAPVEPATHLSIGAQLALPVLLMADALAVAVAARSRPAVLERSIATAEAIKPRTLRSRRRKQ